MMNKSFSTLAAVAVLSLGVSAFAAEAAPAAPAAAQAAPAAAPAAPAADAKAPAAKAAKAMTLTGTVVSSDAIANTLVVKGSKGEETFSIAPTAKISMGKKEVKIADVAKDEKVTVKYTEENGAKTASAVKISAAAGKKADKTSTAAAK
jgi:maltose-binding protein MalE